MPSAACAGLLHLCTRHGAGPWRGADTEWLETCAGAAADAQVTRPNQLLWHTYTQHVCALASGLAPLRALHASPQHPPWAMRGQTSRGAVAWLASRRARCARDLDPMARLRGHCTRSLPAPLLHRSFDPRFLTLLFLFRPLVTYTSKRHRQTGRAHSIYCACSSARRRCCCCCPALALSTACCSREESNVGAGRRRAVSYANRGGKSLVCVCVCVRVRGR